MQLCQYSVYLSKNSCIFVLKLKRFDKLVNETALWSLCLILQIFLNFVCHYGFPWCTFDLKTLLVLFDGDCRRCFMCSCVYIKGITQGNTWGQWELISPIVLYQKHGTWLPQVLGKVRDIKISSMSENIHLWKKSGKIWSNYLAF